MNYTQFVCLIALSMLATSTPPLSAQTPAMTKGISVQMAPSSHATPVPDADNENAWIITVTNDGRIYFGTDQLSAEGLLEQMKSRPRDRAAKLYIKADAGAPFGSVRQVLHAARVDLFDEVVLLTSQSESAQSSTIASPNGLQVWIGTEEGSNLVSVLVGSELKVNNRAINSSALQETLVELFANRTGRIVLLQGSNNAPYGQVIRAIDTCRSAGASRVSVVVSPGV